MSRCLMYALVLPLLAAEIWAQFVAHDWQLTTVFCAVALGVIAVRHMTAEDADVCPTDCLKCRESASLENGEGDR